MGIAIRWKRGKREKIEKYRARYIYILSTVKLRRGVASHPLGETPIFRAALLRLTLSSM